MNTAYFAILDHEIIIILHLNENFLNDSETSFQWYYCNIVNEKYSKFYLQFNSIFIINVLFA